MFIRKPQTGFGIFRRVRLLRWPIEPGPGFFYTPRQVPCLLNESAEYGLRRAPARGSGPVKRETVDRTPSSMRIPLKMRARGHLRYVLNWNLQVLFSMESEA